MVSPLTSLQTTRFLASAVHRYAPADIDVRELLMADVPAQPPYADQVFPHAGSLWKQKVSEVDGLLILVGARHRSIPGALKVALDWASQPDHVNVLHGVPCVAAAVGDGDRPSFLALQHSRTVLEDAGARVMHKPDLSVVLTGDTFTPDGLVDDPEVADRIVDITGAAAGFIAHEQRVRQLDVDPLSDSLPLVPVVERAARPLGPVL